MFEIAIENKLARVGKLKTRRGAVETPFFMPVVTRSGPRRIGFEDYYPLGADSRSCSSIGVDTIICNSLLLDLSSDVESISRNNGIHGHLEFNKVIFTDSGGFQTFEESPFKTHKNDKGIDFTASHAKSRIFLTPRRSMEIQQAIQSDVAMALDDMPPYSSDRGRIIQSLEYTHAWAESCLKYHTDKRQNLFGICQGGLYRDLRSQSARVINSLDFDGVAIGGVAINKTSREKRFAVLSAIEYISESKPRYVMGIGHPLEILEMVSLGIDCFDSIYPTFNALKTRVLTRQGPVDLSLLEPRSIHAKLDGNPCDCPLCVHFDFGTYSHTFLSEPDAIIRLISDHNLYFMHNLMKEVRDAIRASRFADFAEDFVSNWRDDRSHG